MLLGRRVKSGLSAEGVKNGGEPAGEVEKSGGRKKRRLKQGREGKERHGLEICISRSGGVEEWHPWHTGTTPCHRTNGRWAFLAGTNPFLGGAIPGGGFALDTFCWSLLDGIN